MAVADFSITFGDVGWELEVTVKDADNVVVDLTGFTITFKMQSHKVTANTINAAATIVVAASGTVKYVGLVADASLAAGFYDAECLIDPSGDSIYRAPTRNKILVEITSRVLA